MTLDSYVRELTCPFCKQQQDRATPTGGGRAPKDGDFSICINCGEWSVFAGSNLRTPTDAEYQVLATDEKAKRARAAWIKVDEQRRRQAAAMQQAAKLSSAKKADIHAVLDQGFEKSFDALFRFQNLEPEVRHSLRRIFMAGVLTCFERMSRIGEIKDQQEARQQFMAVKDEIAAFCVDTISTLRPKE